MKTFEYYYNEAFAEPISIKRACEFAYHFGQVSVPINTRVNEAMAAKVKEVAASQGQSVSGYIRHLIFNDLVAHAEGELISRQQC